MEVGGGDGKKELEVVQNVLARSVKNKLQDTLRILTQDQNTLANFQMQVFVSRTQNSVILLEASGGISHDLN